MEEMVDTFLPFFVFSPYLCSEILEWTKVNMNSNLYKNRKP